MALEKRRSDGRALQEVVGDIIYHIAPFVTSAGTRESPTGDKPVSFVGSFHFQTVHLKALPSRWKLHTCNNRPSQSRKHFQQTRFETG